MTFVDQDYRKLKNIIATNMRRYRLRLGLTQEEAAEQAGVTDKFWQRIELKSQVDVPSISTLVKIATVLKVKPHQLLIP
mgnify:CR=1 FL=1